MVVFPSSRATLSRRRAGGYGPLLMTRAIAAMKKLALVTFCVWSVSASAWAGDVSTEALDNWHQWRGPLATGMAPKGDPPVRWDEKTNIKWKAAIPGRGASTPIVWGDQVFVLTAVDTGRAADA